MLSVSGVLSRSIPNSWLICKIEVCSYRFVVDKHLNG